MSLSSYKYQSKLSYSPVDLIKVKYDRSAIFRELRAQLKGFSSTSKLYFGLLNKDLTPNDVIRMLSILGSDMDQNIRRIDYCLIYRLKTSKNVPMIWIEAPAFFSPKSLSSYAYSKHLGLIGDFLKEYRERSIVFPEQIFFQYLHEIYGLIDPCPNSQMDKSDPRFDQWIRNPKNSSTVIRAVSEMSEMYAPRV